jgi:CheY-like chemotaxis protein
MPLVGARVLVVEDEPLLRLNLEDMLTELGCIIAASEGTVAKGLKVAQSEQIEIAVLDINLGGIRIDPVCHTLTARSIPFILTTGYDEDGLVEQGLASVVLEKPFSQEDLQAALMAVLAPDLSR